MKQVNFLALASLLLMSVAVGCSDSDAPAAGGAMMKDGAMMKEDGQ